MASAYLSIPLLRPTLTQAGIAPKVTQFQCLIFQCLIFARLVRLVLNGWPLTQSMEEPRVPQLRDGSGPSARRHNPPPGTLTFLAAQTLQNRSRIERHRHLQQR